MVESGDSRPIVTVTGISGYVGSHVALRLLKDGSYRVRGTVRNKNNAEKIDPLRLAFGELFGQVELVEADLLDAASMQRAIDGSTYVIHVASPFVIEAPKDPMVLIRPAVEGTKSVLQACKKAGVRRVSLTSSCVAIYEMNDADAPDVFDESHWSNVDKPRIGAYEKSKTLAEMAAWSFIEDLPDDDKIELTTVNPGLIVGPTMVPGDFTSGRILSMFMNNQLPGGIPRIAMSIVDVREVAEAHVQCIKRDEAQGKRFALVSRMLWMQEIGRTLHGQFAHMGYSIPTGLASYCLVRTIGCCRADARNIAANWGKEVNVSNKRSKEVLGINYRPEEDSLREMAESLMDKGIIRDRRP